MRFNKVLIGLVPALAVSVTVACTKRPQSTAENKDRVGEMDSGKPTTSTDTTPSTSTPPPSVSESAKSTASNVGEAAKEAATKAGETASSAGQTATDAAKSAATAAGTAATSAANAAKDAVTPGTMPSDTTKPMDTTGTAGTTTPSPTDSTATTTPQSATTQPAGTSMSGAGHKISMASLTSNEVKELQTALKSHGAKIAVDGIVGPHTRAALKKFQTQNNLSGVGTLSADTLDKLGLSDIKQAH